MVMVEGADLGLAPYVDWGKAFEGRECYALTGDDLRHKRKQEGVTLLVLDYW